MKTSTANWRISAATLIGRFIVAIGFCATAQAGELKTENVILITADGLRWQELFGGMDAIILADKEKAGVDDPARVKQKYDAPTPEERREKVLPYFWGTLAKQGMIFGDTSRGSNVLITNTRRVSYPGYAELLTGKAHPAIIGNMSIRNFQPTVLEIARKELGIGKLQVAAYCSWSVFNFITSKEEEAIFCNAGYEAVPEDVLTPGMKIYNELQFEMVTPWESARHDTVTVNLALEHMKHYKPRLLYVALDETDDWAHNRKYERVLISATIFDSALRKFSEAIESMEEYRGKTTIVVVSDHGRGSTPEDWTSHGADVVGAERIWMAVFGPDTPHTGLEGTAGNFTQSQIAATVGTFLGIDYAKAFPEAAPPVAQVFKMK